MTDFIAWLEPMRELADDLWARLVGTERAAAEREHDLMAQIGAMRVRAQTLDAIEAGGWWRLRGRLAPLLRAVAYARGVLLRVRRSGRARDAFERHRRAR